MNETRSLKFNARLIVKYNRIISRLPTTGAESEMTEKSVKRESTQHICIFSTLVNVPLLSSFGDAAVYLSTLNA